MGEPKMFTVILKKPFGLDFEEKAACVIVSNIQTEDAAGGAAHWNSRQKSEESKVAVGDELVGAFDAGDREDLEGNSLAQVLTILEGIEDRAVTLELRRRPAPPKTLPFLADLKKPLGLVIGAGKGQVIILSIEPGANAEKWNQTDEATAQNGWRQIQVHDHLLAYYTEGQRIDISKEPYHNVLKHVRNHVGGVMQLELAHCPLGAKCSFATTASKKPKTPASKDALLLAKKAFRGEDQEAFRNTLQSEGHAVEETFFVSVVKPFGLTIGAVGKRVIVTALKDGGAVAGWNREMAKDQHGKFLNISKQVVIGDQVLAIWVDGKRVLPQMTYANVVKFVKELSPKHKVVLQFIHLPPGLLQVTLPGVTLTGCGFRSILWRVYLTIIPPDVTTKQMFITANHHRAEYQTLLGKYPILKDEELAAVRTTLEENPLDTEAAAKFNNYLEHDEEVIKMLRKDISRTFSEMSYFQQGDTQQMLERILFIWTREQGAITDGQHYQQGMHELLAVVVMCLIKDIQRADETRRYSNTAGQKKEEKEKVKWIDVLTKDYLEHDAFCIFSHLMHTVQPFYSGASFVPGHTDATQPFLYFKVQQIHYNLLARYDPELFAHLEKANVLPQLFLIRWLRLLFTREFKIEQSFVIWDGILQSKGIELVDYFCVAMISYIRETLLAMNPSHCLTKVFHYPNLENHQVEDVMKLAQGLYTGAISKHGQPKPRTMSSLFASVFS